MRGRTRGKIIFLALLFLPALSIAQDVTISGYIKDAMSGEHLLGANVYSMTGGGGTISDQDGYFKFKIPKSDTVRIRFSYMGYVARFMDLSIQEDTLLNVSLKAKEEQLEEVVIAARSSHPSYSSNLMNVTYLTAKDVEKSPALFGEPDIIKVLQLKPGMQSGNEGSSGYFVRGGQADQNLILFDGAPVYNPTHLFGMFSLFSNDAIDRVQLYKGGFPARFGGRLSSVLDVGIRPGDKERFRASGGLGLISSRLTLEGPIVKEKVSLLVSGRRTYFDFITREINEANAGNANYQPIPDYYFYDLNVKLHAQLSPDDQLSFTGYTGNDRFDFADDVMGFNFIWGNKVGVLQWKHAYNRKLFHTVQASYSDYQYRIRNQYDEVSSTVGSGINDLNFKTNYDYHLNRRHTLSFGMQYTHHTFNVYRGQEGDPDSPLSLNSGESDRAMAHEAAVYLSDDWQISDRWNVNAGLRLSGFAAAGIEGQETEVTSEDTYFGLEPRLSAKFQAGRRIALKGSYSRVNQFVHLVSSSGSSLPADFWYPSNKEISPQLAEQYALGTDWLLDGGRFVLSNEVYYRHMENQIDFRDGAELFSSPEPTNDLVFGRGWAYGNEFYIEKKAGRTTGWVSYTLSWTYRQFDEINQGAAFPSTQDRRHDISVVLNHQLSDRITFNANWVFCSGNVASLPQSRILLQGQQGANAYIVPVYGQRNSFRLDNYHRLDLGFQYQLQPRWGEADLTLGVYNAYNRRNPYFIFFEQEESSESEGNIRFQAKQVSLFPILPSISFNYRF